MMHKRIQLLKITAAMHFFFLFFFFQKLNSNWEYIKTRRKETSEEKTNAKQPVKASQLCGMRHYAHYELKFYSELKAI